jgi:hypothetical protein
LEVFVFPDVENSPAERCEAPVSTSVAPPILGDLGGPEDGVGLGRYCVLRAAMPEAAIDKHSEPYTDQDDVGPSRQIAPMESEPHATPMKRRAQVELGCGVAAREPTHELPHRRAGCGHLG